MTVIAETTDWRIRVPAERMQALKTDEGFRHLLVLGRLMNSLRLLEITYLDAASSDKPAGSRQRIGAFLFMGSVLLEGLRLLSRIGRSFHKLRSWQERIVPILRSPVFVKLREALRPVRNQAVFHFDLDSFQDSIARCDLEEVVLVAGHGRRLGDVYFPLSDLMAINVLTGPCATAADQETRFKELLTETKDLLVALADAGEGVITEYCRMMGFAREVRQAGGDWHAA